MRSGRRVAEGQECLPFELPETVARHVGQEGAAPTPSAAPRSSTPSAGTTGRGARPAGSGDTRIRLRNDALASRGWPAGTELLVSAGRRPRRGEVALVREGGRLKIGVLEVQFGRSTLRTDHGASLLGTSARFVGVVTVAGAPLEGMPPVPV
ncbi:hypothetical protein JK386_09870 [Nocardioides sp. zg-536]|uniref:Uncharacterized protein n=1 Tax=Nocardioides faecalis TaxID=2803858 RepID=A0A939BVQ6_9ACTN|nr:hypothetical protein [Nocardioides faecalis]MBM9460211.1 hypothetical protein [Nocardioides faecalis]MBS4754667.1 hypothetical protein [Nocardioides faecalis]QVI59998.1 hypothetical protein KG111_06735 [Nocardioides faecalis]